MNLISVANMYRSYLIENKNISEEGKVALDQVGKFLSDIYNQQKDDLKEI